MKKTLCTFWIGMLVLLIAGLAAAPRVEALSAGVACSIEPLSGTDCVGAPLQTGVNYDVLLSISNNSRATCGTPPCPLIGATLDGVIYEWDSCRLSDCKDKLTGLVDFVSATILNPAVIAVQPFSNVPPWPAGDVDPPDIEIIVSGLVLPANKDDIALAIVTKKPLGPDTSIGTCGEFKARFETPTNAVTACENSNCTTGGGQCSTALFYPPNPKLELTKGCDTQTAQQLGQDVNFTVTVKNTGDVPLTNVQLTDATLTLSCDKAQPFTLLQDEVVTCTGTDTCEQTGPLPNTVSATADWDLGTIGPIEANADCFCEATPELTVTKDCTPPGPNTLIGNDINYSVEVRNTGLVKLTVTSVNDPTIPGLACTVGLPAELAPGDFFTCSGTDTCEQLGVLRNDVTVNAYWLNGQQQVFLDPVTAFTEDCACTGTADIDVTKSCDPPGNSTQLGSDINFTVKVKNIGTLTLTNVQLSDPTVALSCSKAPGFSLNPGEEVQCTGKDTCEVFGPLCNTVTATADSPLGDDTATDTAETCECGCTVNPQIQVTKTCDPLEQKIGSDIGYTVEIKNIGNTDLTVTDIIDPTIPGLACPARPFKLTPNQTATCTGSDTCEGLGPLANKVTVKAESVLGPITPDATASTDDCVCKEPKIEAQKTCTPPTQKFGEDITYVITVKNTGTIDLTNVKVADPQITVLDCTKDQPFDLAVNEIVTCTGTLTCPDVNGPLFNEATITAESAVGPPTPVTVSTDDCVCSCPAPALIVDKKCESPSSCEDPIKYTLHIENPGLTKLNCTVTETGPEIIWNPVLPGTIELAPGAKLDFTAQYTADAGTSGITNKITLDCVDECKQAISEEDDAICSIPDCPKQACWLTGGGVKFEPIVGMRMATADNGKGPVISMGGNVNPGCSPTAGDGGNWNIIDHSKKLHFQGRQIEVVECGNIPESIRPPGSDSPKTPFNYIEFQGTGILKGIGGNKFAETAVTFYGRAEDRNEPGSKETLGSNLIDRFWIRVKDAAGNYVYSFPPVPPGNDVANPNTICGDDSFVCTDTFAITGGNLQIHISSCD